MISFSNLYEAVVQQPTPPQPVQLTGAQIPQQQQLPPQYQQYPNQKQQPVQQQPVKKPDGILGSIKAGYDKVNEKYEAGKEVGKGLLPVAASLALPIGLYGSSFIANPAAANTLRNIGMATMIARPMLSAARQAKVVVTQPQPQGYPQRY